MTKINDYMWMMPHTPEADDPQDVNQLQQSFNELIVATLRDPLEELGYELKSSDVMVKLQDRQERTYDTYFANVRFIKYLRPDILTRVHFEHGEWAHFLPDQRNHQYTINLDRFKIADLQTQMLVPGWLGRLHTRMTSFEGDRLEHNGPDQIWHFDSTQQFEHQLRLFLDKFVRLGIPWLEDERTMYE